MFERTRWPRFLSRAATAAWWSIKTAPLFSGAIRQIQRPDGGGVDVAKTLNVVGVSDGE
jgi:hypothetical protein